MICENIIVGLARLSVQASCIMNTECYYKLEVEEQEEEHDQKRHTREYGFRENFLYYVLPKKTTKFWTRSARTNKIFMRSICTSFICSKNRNLHREVRQLCGMLLN